MHTADQAHVFGDNVHPQGHVHPIFLASIIEALRMPAPFPGWILCAHEERADWIDLRFALEVGRPALTSSVVPVKDLIAQILVDAIVRDLAELSVDGDTSSPNTLLAVLDGLKKRTAWPKHFVLSERCKMRSTLVRGGVEIAVKLWIAVAE